MDVQIPFHLYQQMYDHKYEALYHALKECIVNGSLPYGTRLPSSRDMAQLYAISRGIVNQVYEMLEAEGYVSGEVGRGTYIIFNDYNHRQLVDQHAELALSSWAERVNRFLIKGAGDQTELRYHFKLGIPDDQWFPSKEWNHLLFEQIREQDAAQRKSHHHALGFGPLREAIAQYLGRARGMRVEADNVAIVNGSAQAIAMLTQLLVNPGDQVVMEDPGYNGARQAVLAAGGIPLYGAVDQHGIVVDDWSSKLAIVTPNRQFPTGAVLSLERRQQLLQWAGAQGSVIIEDDYDSEFRHKGKPIEPLKVLDKENRVVFIGTFSKTMHPELRIGYVVLPPKLREVFAKAQQLYEPYQVNLLEQRALAAFMNSGLYERHLRRMKRVYGRKFHLLRQLLHDELGDLFEVCDSDAGLHLFAWWKGSREQYDTYRQACTDADVAWVDGGSNFASHPPAAALFGFSHLSETEIGETVSIMKRVKVNLSTDTTC